MGYQLVAFDTDRIQEYVFATGTLREIRGASALLDQLNRERMAQIAAEVLLDFTPDDHLIYANGGSGLFVIDEQYADTFIRQVRHAYRDATLTGSITGVSVALPPEWTPEKDPDREFPDELACLGYRLRCAKDAPVPPRTNVTHALLKPCESCGTEYAYRLDDSRPDNTQWFCRSCESKRTSNEDVKQLVRRLTTQPDQIDPTSQKLWHRLLTPFRNELQRFPYELPDDFNQIGELSDPKNYFGLIYADGNDMGREVEKRITLPERREFATVVDNALDQAVITAIRKHLQPHPKDGKLDMPFDVLLAGGDDLVMVTTADTAIQVASTIASTFQDYTKPLGLPSGKPLTLSVGVALAHAKFPFQSLYKLAEDLCKFAKKERVIRARTHTQSSDQSLINFQVVNASNSLHFKDEFKAVYVGEEGKDGPTPLKCIRTLRPYAVPPLDEQPEERREDTWRRLDTLLKQVQRLKKAKFPRNKLQLLRELSWRSYGDGVLEGKALQNRLSKEQRKVLRQVMDKLSPPQELQIDTLPWFEGGDASYTPFVDLAELYGFFQGGTE